MSEIVVFLGPTMPVSEAKRYLAATFLPPAAQGDVLAATLRGARAIGLVDGLFDRLPAVWHKEILWALSEATHVYGAASMGALRAAELDRFGMRGVGEIYRDYAEGRTEDDDEVAVAHAGGADGFRPLSDAMVDVRATLRLAVTKGVIAAPAAETLLARAKATFYADRRLAALLDPADPAQSRLREWLPRGWVNQKREDAIALLQAMASDLEAGLPRRRAPDWTFQRTIYWEEARSRAEEAGASKSIGDDPAERDDVGRLLDEARLDPDQYSGLEQRALLHLLARRAAERAEVELAPSAVQAALDQRRAAEGLLAPEQLDAWLAARGMGREDLAAVARSEAALQWVRGVHRHALRQEILAELRTSGILAELWARAERKENAVGADWAARASPGEASAIDWYFSQRLRQEVPAHLDAWARAHGWSGAGELVKALRREWCCSH